MKRPEHRHRHPVHVTLRVLRGIPSLRGLAFHAVQRALAAGKERFGFRLVHFSVQCDHLHLIVEAEDGRALSRGVQGLCIRVARAVNRLGGRKGRVFGDRYHARALKTPRVCRLALRYVLLNARKHQRHAKGRSGLPAGFVDPCSSAAWFEGFSRPQGLAFGAQRCRGAWGRGSGSAQPPVVAARTWLLRVGVARAGPFDVDEVPG